MQGVDPWAQRRFGLFVQANLASVPAWAPIGADAAEYLTDLSSMPEVQAHHRDRWSHVTDAMGWADLLHFDRFDPTEWANLAVEAGASHIVQQVRDADRWCWWAAPGVSHHAAGRGPQRDVAHEVAQACAGAGLGYGSAYTPTDDADTCAQLSDLVERVGSRYLWAPPMARTSPAMRAHLATLQAHTDGLILNDAWGAPHHRRSVVHCPEHAGTGGDHPSSAAAWELYRTLGAGRGYNRAETAHHLMSPFDIVALYTEVIARGGALLLGVGVGADGRIPELLAVPLRAAGAWIRTHDALLRSATTWTVWGDAHTRVWRAGPSQPGPSQPGSSQPGSGHSDDHPDGDRLIAVDLEGRGHFPALRPERGQIVGVTRADGETLTWTHTSEGLRIEDHQRRPGSRSGAGIGRESSGAAGSLTTVAVYQLLVRSPSRVELGLFDTTEIPALEVQDLDALWADARPGTVIALGAGMHRALTPVPPGVTVRGLGAQRTTVIAPGGLQMEAGARVEMLHVRGAADGSHEADVGLRVTGADAVALGVHVDGVVRIAAPGAVLRGCELRGVHAHAIDRVQIVRCRIHGDHNESGNSGGHSHGVGPLAGTGVRLEGGSGHLVDGCELWDLSIGIATVGSGHMTLRGNALRNVRTAIHLCSSEGAHLVATSVRTATRAVDIEGGSGHLIEGNSVARSDSGCVVRAGATDVVVAGNHWQQCRIGLLLWEAGTVQHRDNTVAHLLEPEHPVISGPS